LARNNSRRTGADDDKPGAKTVSSPPPNLAPLDFSTPTEFIELPSEGRYYPEDHPLHNEGVVEIRHMTAKDEDILTSRSLLKKGLALDRFLKNILVDKRINLDSLYIGDKNAILVGARITGYGPKYDTQMTCPSCATTEKFTFDLDKADTYCGSEFEEFEIKENSQGTFTIKTPATKVGVEVRLFTGQDEKYLIKNTETKRKQKLPESSLTDQLNLMIVSVSDRTDNMTIKSFIDNMPARDSRYIREAYAKIVPNIDLAQSFICSNCDYETDQMEVPFTTDFFWP
tara:strand:+ start:507 stop:1361 length:855 start_codon:yes stop_codon:yes gene_type:complete